MKTVGLPLLLIACFFGWVNPAYGQAEEPRLRFISDETFRGERSFSFSIGSQDPSVSVYLFAQTYVNEGSGRERRERGGPTSGYFDVDGKRVHTWKGEWHINPKMTLEPGEHTITIALDDT